MGDLSNWQWRPAPDLKATAGRFVSVEPAVFPDAAQALSSALCGPGNDALWSYIPIGPFEGAEQFGEVMAFVGGQVRVALVTVHLPLREVMAALTTERVVHTVRVAHQALVEQVGLRSPRLLVCGPNPHAGDEGLLGHEDAAVVAPAVAQCQAEGIDAVGPVSAEAAFRACVQGRGDMVVACYHDQGLAPLKALEAASGAGAVNWTLGLPIVRTSVDHGTADDIAGQGVADPRSMLAALRWAEKLRS